MHHYNKILQKSPPPTPSGSRQDNHNPLCPTRRSRQKPDSASLDISHTSVSAVQRPTDRPTTILASPTANTSTNGHRCATRYAQRHDATAIASALRSASNQLGWLTFAAIIEAIDGHRVLVRTANGQLFAYLLFRPTARERRDVATIYHLWTHPQHRHRGHAKRLLRRLLQDLRTTTANVLQAWTRHDVDGHRFFPHQGWTPLVSKLPHNARRQPTTLWRTPLTPAAAPLLYSLTSFAGQRHRRL